MSCGLSWLSVPAPMRMQSWEERSAWVRARDGGELMAAAWRPAQARQPSSVCA